MKIINLNIFIRYLIFHGKPEFHICQFIINLPITYVNLWQCLIPTTEDVSIFAIREAVILATLRECHRITVLTYATSMATLNSGNPSLLPTG